MEENLYSAELFEKADKINFEDYNGYLYIGRGRGADKEDLYFWSMDIQTKGKIAPEYIWAMSGKNFNNCSPDYTKAILISELNDNAYEGIRAIDWYNENSSLCL